MEAGGSGGFPGGFAGLPGAGAAPFSSDSNVNTNGVVSVGGAAPPPADAAPAAAGGEPAAKRMKLEPTPAADAGGADAVANMAAIAANRAAGPAIGSGMSTEQFLQALPAAYAAAGTPAYMVMLQQQHQQQQQQQAQAQAQAQRQQLIQQQHLQLQQHIHAQKQLQFQRHLQGTGAAAAGGQIPVAAQQHSPQLQQQYVGQLTPAQAQAHSQAQAIIMAAITKNSVAQWNQLQQQQQQQLRPQQPQQMRQLPVAKAEPTPVVRLPAVPLKRPQPTTDAVCLVCQQEGDDLFVCDYACGVAAHPRCIGENMIVASLAGLKICASCSVMQQDRNTKENLHKGGNVAVCVRRAILCVNMETNAPTNFEKFGHLTSLRLYEISQVAGYPIAPFASRFIEPHLQRWMAEKLVNIASWSISVRDVFTLIIGLYSLDCARISHGWRDKTIEVVRAKNFSTTDYLGWHPSIEGPEVRCSSLCHICAIRNPPELLQCARCRRALTFPTVFTKFTSALLACYYAEHVGIPFGTSFNDVFAHSHTVRSYYKGLKPIDPNGHDWDMFVDQMRMIFGLVDVVSNFGVLELDPDLFDAEVNIIFNQQYLNYAMQMSDYENVGRFLQSMKLFGKQRADQYRPVIEACEKFLVERQQPNGSWCKQGSSVIDQYKSTVACAKALVNPVIRGRGPESSEQRRLLIRWAKKTPGNLHAKRAEQLGQGKLLAAGVTVTGRTVPNQKKLELFYRRQIVPTSGLNSLETLATARLQSIWSTQKPEPQDEDVKDDLVSATTDNEDADAVSDKADKSEETLAQEDDSLIKLSLSGELSLFDGLKFEDGDVIDISGNGEALDDERDEETKIEDDEAEANETAEDVPAEEDEQEDQDDAEEDMYDDDDDAEADAPSQLPEPDMDQSEEAEGDEIDVNAVDMSILDGDLQLDEAYSQAPMDLALDM